MTEQYGDGAAVEPRPGDAAPDEDELRTKRAYREEKGSRSNEQRDVHEDQMDEALDESFPASDPPSYSKGLPKTKTE
jgi:hypothetical protein